MKSVAFTYYSNAVSDIFTKNVEAFLRHTGKYDTLVICSDIQIPSKVITEICEHISVIRVSPIQESLYIKRKYISHQYPTLVNPFLISAFHYQNCESITVFDSHLFLTTDINMNRAPVQLFLSQRSVLSPSLFKFKPSQILAKAASEVLGRVDYTNSEIINAFNFLVANSLGFADRVIETNRFIISNPTEADELKHDRILGFDFLNLGKSPKFKEISEIRKSKIVKSSARKLPFLKGKIKQFLHEFIDTISLSPSQALDGINQPPISSEALKRYQNCKPEKTRIKLIYTKQVANHAKNLEKILLTLGFKVISTLRAPGQLDPTDPDLHIVMCPNVFGSYPKNYIAYQFEQAHSSWFTQDYIHVLNNAIEIWEYSQYNISYFKNTFAKPHIYVPVGTVSPEFDVDSTVRDIDVLFYGEFERSPRRSQFLSEISKLRKIHIVDGFANHKFSNEIVELLKRSKVVLNHHYYENGNLEVVRVYEALSHGCRVVSEVSVDDNFHDLPISKYSTVEEADEFIKLALADYKPIHFKRDQTPYVRSALSRLGFNFSQTKRTAIFAHYDLGNKIDEYVIQYLTELSKVCDDIIFVSDCDLEESEISKIKHLTLDSLCRKHGEANDFGSFKRGFNLLKNNHSAVFNQTTELIFANDSVYCIDSLEPMLTTMKSVPVDAWSAIDHAPDPSLNDRLTYMQTNFMVFSEKVFRDPKFSEFWQSISKVSDKSIIVRKYEIGLSELLVEQGHTIGCYISSKSLDQYVNTSSKQFMEEVLTKINPKQPGINHSSFNRLFNMPIGGDYAYSDHIYTLLKLKSPFIKCLAVVPNTQTGPGNILLHYWQELLPAYLSSGTVKLMLNHISRIGKVPHSPSTLKKTAAQ